MTYKLFFFEFCSMRKSKQKNQRFGTIYLLILVIWQSVSTFVVIIFKDSLRIYTTLNSLLQDMELRVKQDGIEEKLIMRKRKNNASYCNLHAIQNSKLLVFGLSIGNIF